MWLGEPHDVQAQPLGRVDELEAVLEASLVAHPLRAGELVEDAKLHRAELHRSLLRQRRCCGCRVCAVSIAAYRGYHPGRDDPPATSPGSGLIQIQTSSGMPL